MNLSNPDTALGQQCKRWALNESRGKLILARAQLDGLMRFQASRAACLARSQLKLDAPRLAAQPSDSSDSTSSKLRPGYRPRALTPRP